MDHEFGFIVDDSTNEGKKGLTDDGVLSNGEIMGCELGFLVDDSTNEGKRNALPMVLIFVLYSKGRKRLYIGVGGFENTIFGSKGGESQSTSDNWRLKCSYSLS
jgi:hypothetical protein